MAKVGVFICHCGENIARTIDVDELTDEVEEMGGVVVSTDYKYVCSDPGQDLIKETIQKHDLSGVVVAACSPRMHEATFRRACSSAGLNPYLCEMANIREHCSWVHTDEEEATQKAIDMVRMMTEKAAGLQVSRRHWILPTPGMKLSWWKKHLLLAAIWRNFQRRFPPLTAPSAF